MWRATWALLLAGCAPSAAYVPAEADTPEGAAEKVEHAVGSDYLVVTVPAFEKAVAPLLAHRRAQGYGARVLAEPFADANALRDAIAAEQRRTHGKLRYVLLVGDVDREEGLPTFYLPKVDYFADGHTTGGETFPTDAPFSEIDGRAALAIGRVPARSAGEVEGFVKKVLRYETAPVTNAWPRRVVVRAGTAGFGAVTDAAIEGIAYGLLDDGVSYDFDLDFTFGKADSDYAYPPERLGQRLTHDLDGGAFVFAFVGHSGKRAFQSMSYRDSWGSLGETEDFARMHVAEGAPIFVSISCDAGAYDLPDGDRSLAEEAILNPYGPIAAFASSRVSHPYPNLLYGEAFIATFLDARPTTLGDGVLALKTDMLARSNLIGEVLTSTDTGELRREHIGLYNLFGDPATRLRYPDELKITVSPPKDGKIKIALAAPVRAGEAIVTLETKRSVVHHALERDLDALPLEKALTAMAANHDLANDKTLERRALSFDRRATLELTLPDKPGTYVVKAFARGKSAFAAGHAFVQVGPE
jgi:hypothetical protein